MEKNHSLIPSASAFAELQAAEVMPIDLASEYWTPEVGEAKRLIYQGLKSESTLDTRTGEELELLVAYFYEAINENEGRIIRNASRRLVGVFESATWIKPGEDMFLITYLGKKKFNNGNLGDNWKVQRMVKKNA